MYFTQYMYKRHHCLRISGNNFVHECSHNEPGTYVFTNRMQISVCRTPASFEMQHVPLLFQHILECSTFQTTLKSGSPLRYHVNTREIWNEIRQRMLLMFIQNLVHSSSLGCTFGVRDASPTLVPRTQVRGKNEWREKTFLRIFQDRLYIMISLQFSWWGNVRCRKPEQCVFSLSLISTAPGNIQKRHETCRETKAVRGRTAILKRHEACRNPKYSKAAINCRTPKGRDVEHFRWWAYSGGQFYSSMSLLYYMISNIHNRVCQTSVRYVSYSSGLWHVLCRIAPDSPFETEDVYNTSSTASS